MLYLEAENLTRSYGEKVLFEDLSFTIERGQKVALIAPNGTGKSTLLRVIAGLEHAEGHQAVVRIHRDARIGYLQQDPEFEPNHTVYEAILASDDPAIRAMLDYQNALIRQDNDALQKASIQVDHYKAWSLENKIHEILFKLNLTDLNQPVANLSGGQRKRLAMARILLQDPDFMILDEPTNHLDIEMIEWLEELLDKPSLTLLMVTHDRYFMEHVCNAIIELSDGMMYKHPGSYSKYLERKSIREEVNANTTIKSKKLLDRELQWVRRQPKARTTKSKSRVDDYHELKEKTRQIKIQRELELQVKTTRLGSKILEAQYISKSYDDLLILKDFHYKFSKGEKVGIVGPNGVGKSTFLNLLTGSEKPDSGKIVTGVNTSFGFYTQDGIVMNEDKRVIDIIRDIADVIPMANGRDLTAEQLLERFLFSRKHQQVYVSQLSGGERRRLYLLTVLIRNPNFLILDEPTNDLDILTLNILEDFLLDFQGCVLVVTHDRFFMDKIVDHLFIFEGDGKIRDFNGTYSEYRLLREIEIEEARNKKAIPEKTSQSAVPTTGPLSFDDQKQIKKLEKRLETLESKKKSIENKFLTVQDVNELASLGQELNEIKAQIETTEMEWLTLVDELT